MYRNYVEPSRAYADIVCRNNGENFEGIEKTVKELLQRL